MKSMFNKLGYVFIFFFIAGILVTGFYFFSLPDFLHRKSINAAIELSTITSVLDTLNYIILGTAFIGLAAIMFILIGGRNVSENVVYIETIRDEGDKNKETRQHSNSTSRYNNKLEEIQKIINQENNEKLILNRVISKVCKDIEASQGAIFKAIYEEEKRHIELYATFAYSVPDSQKVRFEFGEGLSGQVAKTGSMLNLKKVPEGYIRVLSGLGSSSPSHLVIVPILDGENTWGVIEIASFIEFGSDEEGFIMAIASLLAKKLSKFQEEQVAEV